MKTYAELETEYLNFCKAVEADAMKIFGQAGIGNADNAANMAAALAQRALTQQNQYNMGREQAGGYDLAALRVDAATASNSETGWERED